MKNNYKFKFSLLVLFLAICFAGCQQNSLNDPVGLTCTNREIQAEYDKYKDSQSYYISVNMSSPNIIAKAAQVKNLLSQNIQPLTFDSYSVNNSYASMRFFISQKDADRVAELFSSDPETTDFNKSTSGIGTSYIDALENYTVYKALYDNNREILKLLKRNNTCPVNEIKFVTLLKQQSDSYQSSLKSYRDQLNKTQVQINIQPKKSTMVE